MEYKAIIEGRTKDFDAVVAYAKQEAQAIRTGRANPEMVSDLKLEYLGTPMRLKEIAAISTPDSRSLLIQPWDPNAIKAIEKALMESGLGLTPSVAGTSIRLTVPALTEERRKEYVRLLHQRMEDARIKVRHIREEVQKRLKAADLREDDARRAKEELQKVVDDVNGKIEALMEKKEQELMTA